MAKKKPKDRPQSNVIAKPSFRARGGNGKYTISDCLIYQNGKIASDVKVQFLISRVGQETKEEYITSDSAGYITHKIEFTEPECSITIQGPGFQQEMNLLGPPKYKKSLQWERPPDSEKQKGAWAIITWAFRKVTEWFRS